ncbi:MAG: ribonuclease III domain-containing protein [Pseudomonadota bacterium]|nr:ribonuclease III domain-containing protein [Pseudomonadota bacterium]
MKISNLKKDFLTISEYENILLKKRKIEKKEFQRLEFLGDKVLGLILASLLFDKHNDFTEGMLSRTVSYLCSGKVLHEIACDLSLDIYFKEKEIIISKKGLSDSLEVIIGSFFLNNGYKKTENMICSLWKTKLNKVNSIKVDSKTLLQEWSQSKQLGLPKYSIFEKIGPDHSPTFTIKVKVKNYDLIKGTGNTVQEAEQDAADKFLNEIQKT